MSVSAYHEGFFYDGQDRLERVEASADGQAWQTAQALTYDQVGNITWKSDVGDYDYAGLTTGPHAVTQAGERTFEYDATGNVIRDREHGATRRYDGCLGFRLGFRSI